MAQQTGISWTDATWNPWHGCRKVSQGCKYCYMFRDKERWKQDPTVVMRSKANFNDPLKWQIDLGDWAPLNAPKSTAFPGMKIFTCSWSDFFIEEADAWRPEAWAIIKATPEFTYQILTKRPERIAEHLPEDWGSGYQNVWLGVSAESHEMMEKRWPILFHVPAVIRFVSAEPLIDAIDLDTIVHAASIDWIIVGGESGNEQGKYQYRECDINWIGQIARQANYYGIRVWVKQTGTWIANQFGLKSRHGQDMAEWPSYIQLQEFPILEKNGGFEVQTSNAVPIPMPGLYPVLPTTGITYSKMPTSDEDLSFYAELGIDCHSEFGAKEFTESKDDLPF